MNCKNCQSELSDHHKYCPQCGAQVVAKRINTKSLFNEFLYNFFGWDNSFIKTLRDMIIRPHRVVSDYLNGVRKRYVSPFIFVAVGTGLAMLVFNALSEQYLEFSNTLNEQQVEIIKENLDIKEGSKEEKQSQKQYNNLQNPEEIQKSILKYFNIVTFLLLPLYTLVSFLVFGRKLNYGEHLVVNCYLQGFSFFLGVLLFLASIYLYPPIYYFQFVIIITYYLFTYAKLLNFGIGKAILKLLLFIIVLILVIIVISIIILILILAGKFMIG